MEFTKKQAIEYWKYWHFKDISLIPKYKPSVDNDSEKYVDTSIKKESNTQHSDTKSPLKDINVPFVDCEIFSTKGKLDSLKRSSSAGETKGDSKKNLDDIDSSCSSTVSYTHLTLPTICSV